jgi:predicted  nucleic acid-binding Zn-ribbon protein
MIEVVAAIAGASISVAAMGAMGFGKRNDEARDAVIRLTSAVEHIATQLEAMHLDIKETQRETYARLNSVEQRVSKLEVQPRI